ncbi:MAG: type II/IV secretion system protein [Desulfobacterales bacterium]|nr:type II/IV secretion system protein [Desulfobacterales bacterium]
MIQNHNFLTILVSENILTQDDSDNFSKKYQGNGFDILQHLVRGGIAKKDVLGKFWGDSIGVSYVNLEKTLFQAQVVKRLPQNFALKNQLIPIYQLQDVVTLAMAFPLNLDVIDEAKRLMGCQVSAVFSFPDEIVDAIDIQYQSGDALNEFIARIADNALFKGTSKITADQLEKLAGDKSIIEFTRNLLLLGLKERASDVHIDPQEDIILIRFRIDGVLQDRLKLDKPLLSPLVSRLKIMGSLDITEKRKPQDGRVNISLTNKSIDFRMSTVPAIYGEKIVLRALGQIQKTDVPDIEELNFSKSNYLILKRIIEAPNGIFFVTGPTGSGKSTTLFSVLKNLNKPGINIMTIEDPVEYRLPRVNQVQVNHTIDFSFASALRAFLRQDPDVILIGEIRDVETAKIASQAALTGHLVLATMHTNSALQAVTRLIEIGVEPFLVAPSIIGVMAQRLVRKICQHCKEKYKLSPEEIEKYFIWDKQTDVYFYRGKGCSECNNIGYTGRLALHEVFLVSEEVRELIAKDASILDIENAAKKNGFKTMRYDGMKKVLMGHTTINELERVTMGDE